MKKIIISVSDDITTDMRVQKIAHTFSNSNFEVKVIGIKRPNSLAFRTSDFKTHRLTMFFQKEVYYYAELQIRLFFYLLFHSSDALYANDLDILFPNFLVHKIKRIPLYYDSHEYFTEVPELQSNLFAKKVWERLEKYIFPKLNFAITVCDSIAKIYTEKYHIPVFTIRNVPLLGDLHSSAKSSENCQNKPISLNSPYILYQGAVNVDRGLEEIIDAMEFITSTSLVIAGKGDILEDLKKRVADKKLEKKVIFLGAISPFDLQAYTLHATIGLSIEKDSNLNYKYCLPNKLFDYIRCGIPVLVSPLVEIKKIVDRFSVGEYIQDHDPQKIAQQIINMISQKEKMETYRKNTFLAKKELCWDQEEKKLLNIIEKGYDTTPNHLHIIAFNVPYPANYGGVIDVFYKLKALSECGVQITLHCFLYNREKAQELEKYCKKIYYYPRRSAFTAFGLTPYIVKSRMHRDLLINLLKDRDPILMEGHHDSGFIGNQKLSNRFILLRPCNIEHLYYKNLCADEKRWIPKFYFAIESFRLKFFEKKIKRANVILPISIKDAEYYKKKFPENKVELLNAFHPSEKVEIECSQNLSSFLLFHGDLSISSNEKVAFYLLDALKGLPYPLVFAGKKPSPRLKLACQQYPRVCLYDSPDEKEMTRLRQQAHIHLLFSFNPNGLKLKLLASLFNGKFVICNRDMLYGSNLEELCYRADTPEELQKMVVQLMSQTFSMQEIKHRKAILDNKFSNQTNALNLIRFYSCS